MKRVAGSAFVAHVVDLMAAWAAVSARPMFGGFGIFRERGIFAIVVDDNLYLKADATTQPRFAAAGSQPFVYTDRTRTITMSYWRAPEDCLESPAAMHAWCALAWEAALRSRAAKAGGRPLQRRRNARTKS